MFKIERTKHYQWEVEFGYNCINNEFIVGIINLKFQSNIKHYLWQFRYGPFMFTYEHQGIKSIKKKN